MDQYVLHSLFLSKLMKKVFRVTIGFTRYANRTTIRDNHLNPHKQEYPALPLLENESVLRKQYLVIHGVNRITAHSRKFKINTLNIPVMH